MFATPEFIECSRKFVCVRIETYENKESEKMVRELLNGRFANTAFCVFDPSGTRRLSRSGRSPKDLGRTRGNRDATPDNDKILAEMKRIAGQFRSKAAGTLVLQDFNTFRQALNVASADQRLLVFVNEKKMDSGELKTTLGKVFADEEIVGKFHLNLRDSKVDKQWHQVIQGAKDSPGIKIIRAGKFGVDGQLVKSLSASSSASEIKSALLKANQSFAATEVRKTYQAHVTEGRRKRIYFENEIPYGEDRDGDGKADRQMRSPSQRGRKR